MSGEEMESFDQESAKEEDQGGVDTDQEAAYAKELNESINEKRLTARQQTMLEARKNQQDEGSAAQAAEQLQEMGRKGWRIFNVVTGGLSIPTLGLTLFLTWVAMNAQLILGNWLKINLFGRRVPALSFLEIMILAFIYLIIALIVYIYISILTLLDKCTDIWSADGTAACIFEGIGYFLSK